LWFGRLPPAKWHARFRVVLSFGVRLETSRFTIAAKRVTPGRVTNSYLGIITSTPNPANGSTDMGTEIGNNFTLDFGGGLKADMGAAVLFTGDFYKASAGAQPPATLYEAFTRVQLEF
jgi:hypothetical protein